MSFRLEARKRKWSLLTRRSILAPNPPGSGLPRLLESLPDRGLRLRECSHRKLRRAHYRHSAHMATRWPGVGVAAASLFHRRLTGTGWLILCGGAHGFSCEYIRTESLFIHGRRNTMEHRLASKSVAEKCLPGIISNFCRLLSVYLFVYLCVYIPVCEC